MKRYSKGFTIVEMSFAMTGLSILMVILILSTIGVTSIYNKGLVLKATNQSGVAIGEDVQRSLRSSTETSFKKQNSILTRICTGRVSYLWSVQSTTAGSVVNNVYYNSSGGAGLPVRFARVEDSARRVCDDSFNSATSLVKGVATPADRLTGRLSSTELLAENLAIRYSGAPGVGTGIGFTQFGRLSTFTYTIATASATNEDFIADGSRCEGGKLGEFCALNTFTITAYSKYMGS